MRRWGLLVALLYGLTLAVVTLPLLFVSLPNALPLPELREILRVAADIYRHWVYWLWLGVMVLAQAALVCIRVDTGRRRPVIRRPVLVPILAAGLMAGFLVVGLGLGLMELLQGNVIEEAGLWTALGAGAATWFFWAAWFSRRLRGQEPWSAVRQQGRSLLAGSVLELLVAVPVHVVVRQRTYCCAGFSSFVGIAAGISVMLFAFGPAVLVLLHHRLNHRLRRTSRRG